MARSKRKGQSIVEAITGLFVFIPIALFILDISVLLIGQQANNDLAKRVARAASNHETQTKARTAADNVVNKFGNQGIVGEAQLDDFDFNGSSKGNVVAETSIMIHMPVPIPLVPPLQSQRMRARATEPIVALPAD